MRNDQTAAHMTLFVAALAVALFVWVEVSLRALDGTAPPQAHAQQVAPGLSIAVMHTDVPSAAAPVRNVALNGGVP